MSRLGKSGLLLDGFKEHLTKLDDFSNRFFVYVL